MHARSEKNLVAVNSLILTLSLILTVLEYVAIYVATWLEVSTNFWISIYDCYD